MLKKIFYSDIQLIILTMILICFGIIMLYSASSQYAIQKFNNHAYFLNKHIFRVFLGLLIMFGISFYDYQNLKYQSPYLLVLSFVIILAAHFISTGKTARWLIIGGKNLFTTSDLARITLIIFTSYYLEKNYRHIQNFKKGFLPIILIISFVLIGIITQPDLSTALTIALILSILLFIGGIKLKHLFILLFSTIPSILFLLFIKDGYQWQRIINWLNPMQKLDGGNYQSSQAIIGISNGGFWGQGIGNSLIKFPGLLPEVQTDFIFSVIGEELGFFGISIIILLFISLFLKGIKIAKNSADAFGMYLALGIILNITIYALINICYVVGYLPTTGLPLPFFSYGGTNIITTLLSIGILLNISKKNKFNHFKRNIFNV